MRPPPPHADPAAGAFTLVEMLTVLGVIVLVLAMVMPALNGMLDGRKLDATAGQVAASLRLARQQAITANRDLEVRFYEFREGETWTMKALQAFLPDPEGAARPVSGAFFLPPGVVVSGRTGESTLFTLPERTPEPDAPALPPPVARNYRYRAFLFRANGTPPAKSWLTLRLEGRDAPGVTIAIDAATGRVSAFVP